jgi:DNA-binding PadR family transcriptional regulator
MVVGEVILETKIDKLGKLIEVFDQMSKDLNFGRLSNSEKDVLLNISRQYPSTKQQEINIKEINFVDYEGKPIAKSTLYKVLKSLCDKNLISHLGSMRSSRYKLN